MNFSGKLAIMSFLTCEFQWKKIIVDHEDHEREDHERDSIEMNIFAHPKCDQYP